MPCVRVRHSAAMKADVTLHVERELITNGDIKDGKGWNARDRMQACESKGVDARVAHKSFIV